MENLKIPHDCFYRVTIKGLYVREGKILLARESKELGGKWELPGGGLDFGENIETGFKREINEEMGLEIRKMSNSPLYIWTHKNKDNRRQRELGLDWYYSLIVAYRIDFKDLNFTQSEECETIEFFSKDDLNKIELNQQTKELARIFNPSDFENPF